MSRALFTAIVVLVTIATGMARADSGTESTVTGAVLVKRVPPRYPAKAVERGQEGWVDVAFEITPEGTTSAVHVIAQYPRHVFSRSAVNAVTKWVYSPHTENGIPVPQINNHIVLSFALAETDSIRKTYQAQFDAAADAVRNEDWDTAQRLVNQLGAIDSLHLFELASLEDLRGRIAFGRGDFRRATNHFDRALEITSRFAPEVQERISGALVVAAVDGQEYPRAVAAYDRWRPHPENRNLKRVVDEIRSALATNRPVTISPLALNDDDD